SSRRRHTRFSRDWSSDVCSSDLAIILYLAFYQYKGIIRLKWYYSTAWFVFFIACIGAFPLLSQLAAQAMDTDVVQSRDVVSRAKIGRASCRERGMIVGVVGVLKR